MRKSKPALIMAGTTLYATPPSSLVRFTEVTAPSFKWGFDCSLWWGPGAGAAGATADGKGGSASLLWTQPPRPAPSQAGSPLPLLLAESQNEAHNLVLGERKVRCEGGPRTDPGDPRAPAPCATHQLLCGCVLDESRGVARVPGAYEPHPWETQGGRGGFSTGGAGKALGPGVGPGLPPQEAQCRADSCPEGGPDLRISSKRSPGGKGLRGRGPEFQASLGPCLFWPSLPSAQRCPPPNPYSHQMLRSL